MYKRSAFLLIFFLVVLCKNVYAQNPDITMDSFTSSELGYNAVYNIYNFDDVGEYTIVTGLYSGNRLVDYKSENITMIPFSHCIKDMDFETDESCDRVKVMLLNSMEDMKPVTKYGEIYLGESRKEVWDFSDEEFVALGQLTSSVTVNGLTMNYSSKEMSVKKSFLDLYALYLYGGGNLSSCSVKFTVNKNCTVKLYMSSVSTETREVKIADKNNNQLDTFTVDGSMIVHSFEYNGSGEEIYVFSKSSGVYIYKIELLYNDFYEFNNFYIDKYDNISTAVAKAEMAGGGNIYLQSDYMLCSNALSLNRENSGVTIQSADGYTTVLDFSPMLNPNINTAASVNSNCIVIRGSGYNLKNFIVEKCPGTGIKMWGENCYGNTVENVVSRYNSGGGFSITTNAHDNLLKSCDAYRNCDVYNAGGNADGFVLSISAGAGNKAYNCRAWENSDDGFDNFANHNDFCYEECFCWDNGNPSVFIGMKDYYNNKPLDKNMLLVQMILEQDLEFEERYNNREGLKLPINSFINIADNEDPISVLQLIGSEWSGNPNGYKLGSGYSEKHGEAVGPEAYRNLKNCIAFDHLDKGVDRNNSASTIDLENVISFNNKRNYWLDTMTVITTFKNAVSFGGTNNDVVADNMVITVPDITEQEKIMSEIYEIADYIESCVYNNIIPGEVLYEGFDR